MFFSSQRSVLNVLKNQHIFPPPIWIMRQAGRYLPEYRELRQKAETFLNLCYTPDFTVEATLQPIRRFDLDAAIIFSDILLVPQALGCTLSFNEKGPHIESLDSQAIKKLNGKNFHTTLSPIYESLKTVRKNLAPEKTLLGFSGAPWTLATYMIAGKKSSDQSDSRIFFLKNRESMIYLLDLLSEYTAQHLVKQIKAGADAVQIFDSWSGSVDGLSFDTLCIQPVKKIVQSVRKIYPNVPIIGFPRGAGVHYNDYKKNTGVDALSLDWTLSTKYVKRLQSQGPIQGNLDPTRLLVGGDCLDEGIDTLLSNLKNKPFIFNLGHGILPQTPPDHVKYMIEKIRSAK